MRCPACNNRTRVLETRKRGTSIYRRYQCPVMSCTHRRFSTLESVIAPTGPSSTSGTALTEPSTSTERHASAETSTSTEKPHGE